MNIVETIKMFCDESAEKYSIYENYSGKFMYGRKCVGIVVRQGYSYMEMIIKLTIFLNDCGIESVESELEDVRFDELGLDTIVYFPKIVS